MLKQIAIAYNSRTTSKLHSKELISIGADPTHYTLTSFSPLKSYNLDQNGA